MKLATLTAALVLASNAAMAWDLSKDANDIQVYTRDITGSSLKEFKAEVQLENVTLSDVEALMKDVSSFPEWFADCVEAEKVASENDTTWYNYFVSDAPWPLSDRDMIAHFTMEKTANEIVMQVQGQPEFIGPVDGRVRIPSLNGSWTFTQNNNGVKVSYQLHADPGGSIPSWLANFTVTDSPFRTLANLRKRFNG